MTTAIYTLRRGFNENRKELYTGLKTREKGQKQDDRNIRNNRRFSYSEADRRVQQETTRQSSTQGTSRTDIGRSNTAERTRTTDADRSRTETRTSDQTRTQTRTTTDQTRSATRTDIPETTRSNTSTTRTERTTASPRTDTGTNTKIGCTNFNKKSY